MTTQIKWKEYTAYYQYILSFHQTRVKTTIKVNGLQTPLF
jgi:hypothetical protein